MTMKATESTAHSEPHGSLCSTSFQPSAAVSRILLADRGAKLISCAMSAEAIGS